MASIKEMKNKAGEVTAYKISVNLGRNADGKLLMKYTTYHPKAKTKAKAKKEAQDFAVLYEKQLKEGTLCTDGERIKFAEFLETWDHQCLTPRVLSGSMTERCREEYLSEIRRYALDSIGHLALSKITAMHIDAIVNEMITLGRSPKTIRNFFNALRSAFEYAYKKYLIGENPCARCNDLPQVKKGGELHTFSTEEVQRFLNEALTMEYPIEVKGSTRKYTSKGTGDNFEVKAYTVTRKVSLQFRVFFTLAIYGGFRRGELIALNWNDIDPVMKTIRIDEAITLSKEKGEEVKNPKTEAGKRTIMLPQVCFDLLEQWRREQLKLCMKLGTAWQGYRGKEYGKNPVFIQMDSGKRMYIQTPTAKFKKILTAYNATVPEEKKLPVIRLHDLRHTSASYLIASGIDIETVAKRLGHSKASFTLDIYGHALESMDEKAANALEAAFASR